MELYMLFWERVQERSKGQILVDYLGGTEVFGTFDQVPALQKGLVDIVYHWAPVYKATVPEADALPLSQISLEEENRRGAHEWLREVHKEAGIFYVGRGADILIEPWTAFVLFLTRRVETLQDLEGMRMAQAFVSDLWLEDFGATVVSVIQAEFYSGLERGVVDGLILPNDGRIRVLGLYEVLPYAIDHGWRKGDYVTVLNLDTWNKLPQHLQDLILEVQAEMEVEWADRYDELLVEEKQWLIDNGMEFIKFSPTDEAAWYESITGFQWTNFLEVVSPEHGAKLEELFKP
jgi:TRAP-type C4-dicarboxylate transport system substrate-binding protein